MSASEMDEEQFCAKVRDSCGGGANILPFSHLSTLIDIKAAILNHEVAMDCKMVVSLDATRRIWQKRIQSLTLLLS